MFDIPLLRGALSRLFLDFFEPQKRLFWGNIVGSLALILIISGTDRWKHLKTLVDRRIWWHPSSRADMKIIAVNAFLRTLFLGTSFISAATIAALISLALTRIFGAKLSVDWPQGAVIALYALVIFVVDDFARFFLHFLQHRWRWLWVFHQVHHSALVLTPLTLMRTHPIEILSAQLRDALAYGAVSGVFLFAFQGNLDLSDVLGMQAFALLFNFLGANIRHSQVWLHFGRFEGFLISPAAHQVHHSADRAHHGKNFGVCLALWDRLAGSFLDPRSCQTPLQFGLSSSPLSEQEQRLITLYWHPFKELFLRFSCPSVLRRKKI